LQNYFIAKMYVIPHSMVHIWFSFLYMYQLIFHFWNERWNPQKYLPPTVPKNWPKCGSQHIALVSIKYIITLWYERSMTDNTSTKQADYNVERKANCRLYRMFPNAAGTGSPPPE
jgi:hypothetical protein